MGVDDSRLHVHKSVGWSESWHCFTFAKLTMLTLITNIVTGIVISVIVVLSITVAVINVIIITSE